MTIAAVSALPAPLETPLLPAEGAWIKGEGAQLTGSVKYRMVYAKLQATFRRGVFAPGTILTEVSSGSTGVALAWAGQRIGCAVEIHAFSSIAPEKARLIERAGARLVLHASERSVGDLLEDVAANVRRGGYWHLGQYDGASVQDSYRPLAAELLRQLRAREACPPKLFVCPVGTGGLIQGVGSRLREEFPGIRVVAVEPLPYAKIDGVRNTELFHLGKLDPYDKAFPDDVVRVDAPTSRANLGDRILGASASAAVALVKARGWMNALVVAPD